MKSFKKKKKSNIPYIYNVTNLSFTKCFYFIKSLVAQVIIFYIYKDDSVNMICLTLTFDGHDLGNSQRVCNQATWSCPIEQKPNNIL